LRFLMEGAAEGEKGLYVTLSETANELRSTAESHGWELSDDIEIFEVAPPESLLDADQQQSLLYSSDLELGETTKLIFQAAERTKAKRIVLDSLSEIRLLGQSSLRYRRQILALEALLSQRHGSTVLLLDDLTGRHQRQDRAQRGPRRGCGWRDGAALRQRAPPACGSSSIAPKRSAAAITTSASRPAACRSSRAWLRPSIASRSTRPRQLGHRGLDTLLGGGIEQGSSTVLLGRAARARASSTLQFVCEAIRQGGKAAMFIFDEEIGCCSTAPSRWLRPRGDARRRQALIIAARRGGAVARRVRARVAPRRRIRRSRRS
jgi:circadian clock protein KaiC